MGRLPLEKAEKLYHSTVRLLRNTTWKCGKVERFIIQFLREKLLRQGKPEATVRELWLQIDNKKEFHDALKRLQKRKIIELKNSDFTSL